MKPKSKRNKKWIELKKAGWSSYKIARRYRVTAPRVNYVINRDKNKQNNESDFSYGT
jgi:orotate phosphoribosyltransferase-like protein